MDRAIIIFPRIILAHVSDHAVVKKWLRAVILGEQKTGAIVAVGKIVFHDRIGHAPIQPKTSAISCRSGVVLKRLITGNSDSLTLRRPNAGGTTNICRVEKTIIISAAFLYISGINAGKQYSVS